MQRLTQLRLRFSVPLAVAGGLLLDAGTPSLAWWFAALLGVALISVALWEQRWSTGLLIGAIAGASFWLPNISWLTLYLGPVPWLALSALMIIWFALFGLLSGVATRGIQIFFAQLAGSSGAVSRSHPTFLLIFQSLVFAGLWVSREFVQSNWPYGGFAWGRIAHTQADGPLAAVVSWIGTAGFSGLLVCVISAMSITVWKGLAELKSVSSTQERLIRFRGYSVLSLSLILLAGMALIPTANVENVGSIRVAAIQGNSKSGVFDDRENGDVFQAHVSETEALLTELEASGEHVDVILWPENSGEFGLPSHVYRSHIIALLAERAQAPLLIGTVLEHPNNTFTNSAVLFDDSGATALRYDKRRPVPFAEYMPNREFFRPLAPDLVDLVQLDYSHGELPAVLPLTADQEYPAGGNVESFFAGIAICFDIIFDDQIQAMFQNEPHPAQIIFALTNNADFGTTDESAQQLQIARLRAIETGRVLVNISTVGTSEIVSAEGETIDSLVPHTAGFMTAEVNLYTGLTPGVQHGNMYTFTWLLLGLGGVAFAMYSAMRHRYKKP